MRLWRTESVLSIILVCGLSACGGGSGGGNDAGAENPDTGSDVNQQVLTVPASDEDFLEEVKRKLKQSVASDGITYTGLVVASFADNDSDVPELTNGFDTVSDTNTLLEGVDESDYVKYDGRYLYSYQTGPAEGGEWQNRISVIDAQPDVPAAVTAVDIGDNNLVGMYLRQLETAPSANNKQIIAVTTDYSYYYAFSDFLPGPSVSNTRIRLIDGLPLNPEVAQTISIDGFLLASRLIDNRLVLVTGHLPELIYRTDATDLTGEEERLVAIDALTAEDILPGFQIDEAPHVTLASAEDCFVLEKTSSGYGLPQILTITTIDLNDTASMNSTCTTSFAGAFFISSDSLIVTDFFEGGTLIHKFALSETGASYRGSGEVKGYVRGGEYSFHLYEQDNNIFALSSFWENDSFTHQFTVFQEDVDEALKLSPVAQLPNENEPQSIGKPGEDIYGVRFFDDTAFVVTFERIDPLYAIDISNPLAPAIVGELELPGVSEYLHPISSDLLLGIGHNGQWPRELQVNLFDISDKTQPSLITQENFTDYQGAWTSLTYDHHAFAAVADTRWTKAAFPFSVYPAFLDDTPATDSATNDAFLPERNYLALLDIDKTNKTMVVPRIKSIQVEEPYSYYQRVVIDDDEVIFVSNSKVEKLDWE